MNEVNCIGWEAVSERIATPTRIASLSDLPTMGEVKLHIHVNGRKRGATA
jgi:hypothetical protein